MFLLGSREIDYAVRPSPRGKRLRVRVSPEGVQLILPVGRTEAEGRAFIERHGGWVKSQLAFVARAAGLQRPKDGANTWSLLFRGRETRILVRRDGPARGARIEHRPGSITIQVAAAAGAETVRRGLVRWLRRQSPGGIDRPGQSTGARNARGARPDVCDGAADEMGQLLAAAQPVVQLAPGPRAAGRARLPRRARTGAPAGARAYGRILAHRPEFLPSF